MVACCDFGWDKARPLAKRLSWQIQGGRGSSRWVGRVRSPAFLSILGELGIGTVMEDSNSGMCMNRIFPQTLG